MLGIADGIGGQFNSVDVISGLINGQSSLRKYGVYQLRAF